MAKKQVNVKKGTPRRERVYVYFTKAQKKRLIEKAKNNDMTLSGLIVNAVESTIDNQTVLDLEWEKGDFE